MKAEFPEVHSSAIKTCVTALGDARISCFYARVAVEPSVTWAFEHDRSLPRPYDSNLSALLHEPAFNASMGYQVLRKVKEVIRSGNRAAHDASLPSNRDAAASVSHLFEFLYWLGRTYIRGEKPSAGLTFDPRQLPPPAPNPLVTAARIRELHAEVEHEHGAWRVGGTRVTLEMLVAAFDRGDSPEEIHEQYPSAALGDVYAVLTYCLRHPVSVKEYLTAREVAGPRCKPASKRRSLPKACAPVWCRGSGSARPPSTPSGWPSPSGSRRADARRATGTLGAELSNDPVPVEHVEHLELPVEELLRRGRPFPPREEMVIDDLTPEEGEAFLEAVRS